MMRLRVRGFVVLFLLAVSVSMVFAQQGRSRNNPAAATPPPQADLRIKYRSTTSGQSYESATMIKGKRERSEMRMGYGSDIINITQCDLKRVIQVSDKTQKYVITPMQTINASSPRPAASPTTPIRRVRSTRRSCHLCHNYQRHRRAKRNVWLHRTSHQVIHRDRIVDRCLHADEAANGDRWLVHRSDFWSQL